MTPRQQLTALGVLLVKAFGAFCIGIILAAAFFATTGGPQ